MADNNPYEYPPRQTDGGQAPQQPVQPQYQYPPAKPTSVTVFGVLNCVFGGLGILCTPISILGIFIGDLIPMSEMKKFQETGLIHYTRSIESVATYSTEENH